MNLFAKLFTTLFGLGFTPIAPGTIASAVTIVIWYIYIQILPPHSYAFVLIFIFILSIYLIDIYTKNHSSDDPKEVVIDEFIGQSLPLLFISHDSEFFEILLVFVTFRIFDIYKIYPVNLGEKIKGSFGVIADDLIAGLYTIILLMLYKIILG